MVPMVGSKEEAEHIVSCTRYPPAGRRGAAFGFAHDDYTGGDVPAKMAAADARTHANAHANHGKRAQRERVRARARELARLASMNRK